MTDALGRLRQHIESTCDYVGPAFPEVARRIHYGEAKPRQIYGEASESEATKLKDEGIEVRSVPWIVRRDG
jgi:hypothetical protein